MTMTLIPSILLALFAAWFLTRRSGVTFGAHAIREEASEIRSLSEQRDRFLQVLKDLEFDHSLRKVSDADYVQMKQSLSVELADVLKRLDSANSTP